MKPVPKLCPTPWKAYRIADPDTARRTAEAFSTMFGKHMEAYLCPCRLYHLRDRAKRARHRRELRQQ